MISILAAITLKSLCPVKLHFIKYKEIATLLPAVASL